MTPDAIVVAMLEALVAVPANLSSLSFVMYAFVMYAVYFVVVAVSPRAASVSSGESGLRRREEIGCHEQRAAAQGQAEQAKRFEQSLPDSAQ